MVDAPTAIVSEVGLDDPPFAPLAVKVTVAIATLVLVIGLPAESTSETCALNVPLLPTPATEQLRARVVPEHAPSAGVVEVHTRLGTTSTALLTTELNPALDAVIV